MMMIPHAPFAVPPPMWHTAIATFKRDLIEKALRQSRGNRTRAAEALGLQRTYLLRLMREMGLNAPQPVGRRAQPRVTVAASPTPLTTATR